VRTLLIRPEGGSIGACAGVQPRDGRSLAPVSGRSRCRRDLRREPDESDPNPDPATSNAPYQIYNIGNHSPAKLLDVIEILENELGKKAIKNMLPMQPGDVPATFADVDDLARDVDFAPRTPIETGVKRFIEWYREYYRV
jgi:UDP-glucuronate 4-epimerase